MTWTPDPLMIAWQEQISSGLEVRGYPPGYVPLDGLAYADEFRDGKSPEAIIGQIVFANPTLAIYAQQTLLLKQIIKLLER